MQNINLNVLNDGLKKDNDDHNIKNKKYNDQYHKIVSHEICPSCSLTSGCMACGVEYMTGYLVDSRNIVEVSSNGILGDHYCEVTNGSKIAVDQKVIINNDDSFEIATIIELGDIVRRKRAAKGLFGEVLPLIDRVAKESDLETYSRNLSEEQRARPIFNEKINKFNLEMKLVDIHYQFDRKKLFFFYTADGRIDFRALAKELASEFKTRIELRQIGVRDEAKRIGGLGTCGREYCCASFLDGFQRISTHLATEQNLSSSISKLSGPCNKLKCCLSFEKPCNN